MLVLQFSLFRASRLKTLKPSSLGRNLQCFGELSSAYWSKLPVAFFGALLEMKDHKSVHLRSYKRSEWNKRKDHITRLYRKENLSVDEVIASLASTGFYVNKRMIMTRIMQWGIGRNHKFQEMCAAIQLLADDKLDDLSDQTTFVIRGQNVSLKEIVEYFRRKAILDPAGYVRRLPPASGIADVQLQQKIRRDDGRISSSGASSADETASDSKSQRSSSEPTTTSRRIESFESVKDSPITMTIVMSTLNQGVDRLLWSTTTYIHSYRDSARQVAHQEPQVHHLTVHGRFGTHMQEGISFITRKSPKAAFASFNRGFDLTTPLLLDDHPMALALILTLICELLHHQIHPLIKQLLKHICELSEVTGRRNHPISDLFEALSELDDLSHWQVIRMLRRADDDFRLSHGRLDWRSLYIRERLCDALYYAKEDSERYTIRRELLRDQINRYGPNARNVLWTQAMVADDLMEQSRLTEAQSMFKEVLDRADHLEGFGRAKTRFAALEGLGNAELKKVNITVPDVAQLERAVAYFNSAESEAQVWFEHSTRRLERVRVRKHEAMSLLSWSRMAQDTDLDCLG